MARLARSGRELFYLDLSNALAAVTVRTTEPTFSNDIPAKLFDTRRHSAWSSSSTGSRN